LTSLLGRLFPLFIGPQRVEDLFTEAVARLFERRPEICLNWLDELELITSASGEDQRYTSVSTQKSFVALDEHGMGSRPDLIVEVHHAAGDEELESSTEIVMIESKIGSWEGQEQLKRYAGHLSNMSGTRRTLIYITRAYDPKDEEEILAGTKGVEFCQLRWHDFYTFLQKVETDALVEEVMLFMEEQRMARSYRFSTADLMALSGVPRAFEIFDETFHGEVQAELVAFAGNKIDKKELYTWAPIRNNKRYIMVAHLNGGDLDCFVAYELRTPDGYPEARVYLEAWTEQPGRKVARKASVAAMRKIALRDEWDGAGLDNPAGPLAVWRGQSLASLLHEEDHVAAVKRFFIESIRELREELTEFKKENPDLPWNGGNDG